MLVHTGTSFQDHITTLEGQQDVADMSKTGTRQDSVETMLKIPEFADMLLGLTQYGTHFLSSPKFSPSWWSRALLDTSGMVRSVSSMSVQCDRRAHPW